MLEWEPAIDEHGIECPHLLHLSEEARSEYHAFAQAIEVQMRAGGDFEHFTDWAGKAPGAAVRLAGVLHAIEHAYGKPWKVPITAKTMNAAVEIMAVFFTPQSGSTRHDGRRPDSCRCTACVGVDQTGQIVRFHRVRCLQCPPRYFSPSAILAGSSGGTGGARLY